MKNYKVNHMSKLTKLWSGDTSNCQPFSYHRCLSTDVRTRKTAKSHGASRTKRVFTFASMGTRTVALYYFFSKCSIANIQSISLEFIQFRFYFKESQVALMLNRVMKFADQVADYRIQTIFH